MRGVLPPFRTTVDKNLLRRRRAAGFSHSLDPKRTSSQGLRLTGPLGYFRSDDQGKLIYVSRLSKQMFPYIFR
jgi:hypothetical protein